MLVKRVLTQEQSVMTETQITFETIRKKYRYSVQYAISM